MRPEIHSLRMALGRQIATCLAVFAGALAFTACGEESSDGPKIPKTTANQLIEELGEVENQIDEGDCSGESGSAPAALADVRSAIDEASEDIDREIVADMLELLDGLEEQVNEFCADVEDEDDEKSTTSSTTSTTATSTDTSDEEETTTSTEEETKETTTEEPEPEPEPEPPEPEPTPPGNGPEGEGPPGQDGGFETDDGGFAPERGNAAPNGGQG